jgi:hypothetical protein
MVEDLIRRARRRFILNDSLAQTAFAASIAAGGLVLLLILGTTWLEWWTIGVLAGVAAGLGIYRVIRQTPGPYKTAVQLDESAHLQDSLSTSLYFSGNHRPVSESFLKSQHEQAEAAAATINLESVVPFTFPKALYAMAALFLAASGLVALRYRVGRGLDLRRPLTEVLFEDQAARSVKKNGNFQNSRPGDWTQEAQDLLAKLGVKPDGPTPGDPDALENAIDKAMQQAANQPTGKDPKGGNSDKAEGKDSAASDNTPGGDPIEGGEKKDGDPKNGSEAGSKEGDPGDKGKPGKSGDSNKESLMSKLKDAVSNLMAKNKQDSSEPQKSQDQKSAKGEQKKGDKKGEAGQGKPEKGSADSDADESDPDGDALGGQKGEGKETTASNQKQQQEGSGIGSADGSKEIKAAEQLKAMGKISEIIGKRSATVSGETTVEVQSGNQSLHTAYSTTNAAHAETDGDVTRDEIPVSLQAYVQQYFTEVRKAAKPKGSTKTTP